ncbi:MAG: UvrD-helicase domain-containing protein, partial [Oscillospiraceae bacterium]
MGTNWTSEQLAAIDAKGKLTVLSAAAGSGKTTVLVEKALRILLDEDNKTSADRLLIATFSNASAKEFKNKIERGLNKKIKENPDNTYIKTQKMALQKADISTIHAFCIKLTRENFETLNLSPDFTICDEAKALVLHDRAIDYAMQRGYTLDSFARFVSLFGKSSQDKQVREFLKEMFYYFSALPFPRQKAQELSCLATDKEFGETEVYKGIHNELGQEISYAKYLVNREAELYDMGCFEGYENSIEQDKNLVERIDLEFSKGKIDKVWELINAPIQKLGTAKPKCAQSTAIQNVRKKLKETISDMADSICYLDAERYEKQKEQTTPYIKAMTEVFILYYDRLLELKREQKTFEFSDFEHFAVELLVQENGERTPLAKTLQEKYVKIMEDEFQDTSFVQDMIFTALSRENEENLFVVGDVKQSIYGFRKASPEILLKKRQIGIDHPDRGITIMLPHNFRSEKQVIDGVNYLFERIMSTDVGSVNYRCGEQLKPPEGKQATAQIGVQIDICCDKEPQLVAQKIKGMIDSGFKIADQEGERAVTSDDFCILLRNTKNLKLYGEALKEQGLKAYIKDNELILNKPEVQSVISVLRIINNPLQEVYLTAGMFGELFGFSLDEILKVRLGAQKDSLYRALALSKDERAVEFLETLKDFAAAARVYSADKLVNYIIKKTGYYQKLAFEENGEEKRENLRWFIAFSKNYALGYQSTLNDFIRWIDLYIQSGKGASTAFQRPSGTVAIMTMHTSKGLEFPICFVSGLGTKFNKQDRSKRLMMDTQLGMATYSNESFGCNVSTAGVKAIKDKILATLADDEMRLLYVALTRAKNMLFLTAQYNNLFTENTLTRLMERTSKQVHPYAVRSANTPIEWVLMGYLDHKGVCDGDLSAENSKAGDFLQMNIINPDDITSATIVDDSGQEENQGVKNQKAGQKNLQDLPNGNQEGEKPSCTVPKEELERMMQGFNYRYKNIDKTKLPIKLSVGEIAKAPPPIKLPVPFFAKEQKVTAAQRGTAMHSFAQHTDILLARANLDSE